MCISSQYIHLINHDCLPNVMVDEFASLAKTAETKAPVIVLRAIRKSKGGLFHDGLPLMAA